MVRLVKLTERGKKKETASGGGTVRLVKLNEPKTDAAEELRREAALKRARDQMAQLETPEKAQLRQEAAQKRARDMQTRSDRIELENLNRLSREAQREREKKTGGGGVLGLLAMAGRSADSTLPMSGSGQVALDLNSSPAQLAYDRSLAQFRAGEIARAKAQQDAQMKQWAAEHPVKGSAASVVTNIMSGAEALADLTAYGSVGEMMPEGMDFSPTAATGALREGASSRMGNAGQFVYSTGMSAIDSLVSNEVLLGLSAASNAIRDVKARGGTDRQAAISGVFSGLAESFFEHVSLGQLRALKDAPVDGIKTLLKNMGKQMFVNFSEESFTELANILFDSGFMGDLSNYAELARQYMDEGMSEKEAKRKALGEMAKQIGLAGASGALMGLGFGALGSAQGYLGSRALNISAQTDSGAKRPGQAAQGAGLKPADGTLPTGDNRTGEQAGEARQQSETQRTGEETAEQYPNLRKVMDGEAADPNAVAAEAAKAVDAGVITGEEGLELTRRAITAQRAEQQSELQPERQTGRKAPGFYGEATKSERKRLDRLAKAVGLSIERVPAAEAGDREGWIIGGRAYLSEQTEDPLWVVAIHEVTHYLQEMAPEAYNEFRSYVEDVYRQEGSLDGLIAQKQESRQKNGQELTAEEALDELAANYAGELLDNEALIRKLAGEKPNIVERVLDGITALLQKLRSALSGEEYQRLEDASKLWEKALVETNRAYYQEGKRASESRVRNQFKDSSIERTILDYNDKETTADTVADVAGEIRREGAAVPVSWADVKRYAGEIDWSRSNRKAARQFIQNILTETLGDDSVFFSIKDGTVVAHLVDKGKDHYTNYATPQKAAMAEKVRELISTSRYAYSTLHDEHSKGGSTATGSPGWDNFVAVVRIDGGPYDGETVPFVITTREIDRDKRAQIYDMHIKTEMATSREGRPVETGGRSSYGGFTISADKIAQEKKNVKSGTDAGERRSVKGERSLEEQVRRLTRQNKRLQEQMKRTDVPKASRKAVERQAAELREAYGSRIDKTALADRIEGLYEKIAAKSDGDANAPGWKDIKTEARTIADDILAQSRGNVNPKAEEYAGLRREMQKTKVSLSPEYRADLEGAGGYNELRKRLMGSLILSNEGTPVDVLWNDLSDRHPELFPDDIYQPADQLLRLAEVVQSLKKVEGNPYGQDMEHTAAYLAGEIEERFFDTPQEKPTQVDKMEAKYHRQRLADQRVNAEKLRRQREAHAQELKDMEAVYAEENRRRIERQSTAERRETILRHAQRLGRKLVRPTDKQHVPEDMRGAALAMVTYLDLESNYETVYGKDAKYHRVAAGAELGAEITNRTAAARALQAEYRRLAEEDTSLTIDPDMDDYLDEIARMGNKRVADMNRSELDTVWKAMQVVEHTISRADDLLAESRYRTVSQMADALREENGGKKDRANWAGGIGMADRLLNLDMLAPETFFHRMGKAGEDIFRQMRRAADRQTVILKEGTDRAAKLIEESGVSFEKADAALHTFDLDGGELTLSTGQIMELYALSKREQALEHIYIGGLKPVDATLKGKLVNVSRPVKVTPADVAEIISKLSDKERTLMDGLQKYMSGDLARHGNEESRKVYGYDKFREKNYWPIKVSAAQVASDPTKAAGAKTIPGYGMTKALKPKANNAVELRSAIDTYSRHLNQMATYAAWLGTNENITKLQNFTYVTENGAKDGTVKELIEKVYGRDGNQYVENLLGDIAQGTKAGADRSFAEMGLSRFKAAKVGGNLRVIIQQPTAILRAMWMIDPKYFAAAKSPLKGWEKAKEHSPIAQWKDWGYFEMDTGRSLRELMTGTENKLDKAKNAMMAPAGMADSVAWGHLWNAVEAETLDKRPELEQGSKAFYEAVAERFGEVVDRTQVVDTVLHRTQIMRSSNYANKVATSFMSEPSKVYNMVLRAFYDLNAATAEETRKAAGKRLARTSAALITSFAVNALAQSVVDALRDDDRDKDYWEKLVDNWGENFVENFNVAGYVPYAKDVVSLAKGYTLDRSEMEGVADAIKAIQQLERAFKGKTEKSVLAAGLDAASKLGDMIGLPVSNIRRDAGAIFHTVMNSMGAGRELYRWNKIKYNPETAMSIFQSDLYHAMDTDWATYEMIYGDIMAELQEQGKTEEEAADSIKKAVEKRMKKALGVNSVGSLPIRYSPPGENEEFDAYVKAAIDKNTSWEDELPEDVVELVQEFESHDPEKTERVLMIAEIGNEQGWADIMLRQTLSDSEVERYEQCRKQGVTMKEWAAAYSAIGGAAYQRTGKRTASQEDVKTALGKMNLSNAKRTAIWNSYG